MIRKKYFKKLFFIFFAFTLVYGLMLTSYFVVQNSRNLKEQQIQYHISRAEQTVKNLDQRIWSLGKYTDTLFLDDYFIQYLVTNNDYYVITKVYDKLRTDMAVFVDMGARIGVSKMEDDRVITNQFTRNLDMFYEEMGYDVTMVKAIELFYQEEGNAGETLILHDEGYQQIHFIKKRKVNNNAYLMLFITIDLGMLQRGSASSPFDFYFEERQDDIGEIGRIIEQSEEDYLIEQGNLYLLRQSSIYPGIKYIVEGPYEQVEGLETQYYFAVLLFMMITVIGFMIALILTRTIYKPIGTVLSKFGEEDGEADDEFAFLEKMTYDIMNANEALKRTIGEHRMDLRTKFLRELAYGLMTEQQMLEGIRDYKVDVCAHKCRVVLIELVVTDGYGSDYLSAERSTIKQTIHTILTKTLTLEGLFYELVELDHSSYALIIGEWQISGLKSLLAKLLKAIEANEEVDILMAIGEEVEDYAMLHSSYYHARSILDYKQSYDKRAIVTMEDVLNQDIKEKFHYPLELERELYNATLNGLNEKIQVLFDRIVKANCLDRQLNDREFNNLVVSMMTTLRRVDQKMPKDSDMDRVFNFEQGFISGQLTGSTVLSALQELFEAYAKASLEQTASKDDEISALMIHYIHDHYHEDISLEEAATHLNISAGYFCTVFKKQTGTNFKSYLNGYRVIKAKEILQKDPTVKIKDLTLQLGYNNVNSFIRMFKKYEGISPGEYARRGQSS